MLYQKKYLLTSSVSTFIFLLFKMESWKAFKFNFNGISCHAFLYNLCNCLNCLTYITPSNERTDHSHSSSLTLVTGKFCDRIEAFRNLVLCSDTRDTRGHEDFSSCLVTRWPKPLTNYNKKITSAEEQQRQELHFQNKLEGKIFVTKF